MEVFWDFLLLEGKDGLKGKIKEYGNEIEKGFFGGRNKQSGENKHYRTKFTECLRNINTFLPALHLLFSPLRALTFLFSIFILLLSIPAHYPNINNAPVKLFPSISFPPTDLNTENLFSFVSNFSHPILFLKNEPSPPPFFYTPAPYLPFL